MILIDSLSDFIEQEYRENPQNTTRPEHLAYVMYTSGSTGTAKGVSVPHRGVVRLVKGTDYVHFHPDDVFLQLAPIFFDAATFEIWGCLLNGGRLVVAPPGLPAFADLGRALQQHEVTVLWLTAGLFREIVDCHTDHLRGVRQLLVGGDVLPAAHVRKALRALSRCTLINGYGPTENTTFSCCHALRNPDEVGPSVPIGRPIANTQAFVLDGELQPVPVGVAGELFVAGDGLARGYWKRPGLTAEKFLPNPFSAEPGARLYRTGDLVRRLPDGTLTFLGRLDGQVKIRGFRVEPGEIESILRRHPGLRDAVVMADDAGSDEKTLVAYVVAHHPGSVSAEEILRWLQERLPAYMLPASFVWLTRIPLTSNGKVDSRALRSFAVQAPAADKTHTPAQTALEELLAGIWREVLGIGHVGIHDSFFDSGGHSLRATRVISRIRKALGVEVPMRAFLESPTIADLARHIESEAPGDVVPDPQIKTASRRAELPLSYAQQRLWFLDQLERNSSTYNIPYAARLTGLLDIPSLQRSLDEVVRRHEALRTRFVMTPSPVQQISPARPVTLPLIELSTLPPAAREIELQTVLAEVGQRPFDLSRDLMLRSALIRLADREHVLAVTVHHIAADGWSMGILFDELAALYGAFRRGEGSPLPELAVQYADYTVWQQSCLQGARLGRHLEYWTQRLRDAPAVLELPSDFPRPAVQTQHGARECAPLAQELVVGLEQLGRREGTTLFMTLLAAFKVLMLRYSGQEDVVVGSPIAGRNRLELETLIGCFVNTLALRTDLSGNPTFRDLLGRVRETTLGAYTHQDLPFERLVQELHPKRDPSRAPVFQVMFALQQGPATLRLEGLDTRTLEPDNPTAKFDLTFSVVAGEEAAKTSIEYNTDIFRSATIRRMLGHWTPLLEGIAADSSRRVMELPLLSEDERLRLLVEWNDTKAEYPQDCCVHQLFEAQVQRTPEADALVLEDRRLTYGELNERANRLAHHLRELAVGPDELVPVCMDRSFDMVVALLGVLKAGAAYVPLDPSYPQDRLSFMLRDTNARVVVSRQTLSPILPQLTARLVCLDADADAIRVCSGLNPGWPLSARNLAYVLYTSGSTGRPKGVAVEHRNSVAFITWAQRFFSASELAGVLASTSICFDLSVFEIFVPLSCGGKAILAENAMSLPWLPAANDVTLVNLVPSALAYLLDVGAVPSSVRTINSGGEVLSQSVARRLYHETHAERVFDLYGPTEATTYSSCALRTPGGAQTIGRPISNTRLYILDGQMQPAPTGVPGEIYIGGSGITRGYLHRPELTAERFVCDPFTDSVGARMYRTGDLGRYLPDGAIEFLGRRDQQVKIRGFRIELGEIDALLRQHPRLRDAVVVDREHKSGDRRLVACVVPQPGQAPCQSDLRRYLQDRLPGYMVPSTFEFLARIPLTSNGKVNRSALAALSARQETQEPHITPRGAMEELLSGIWREVLDLEKVSVDDSFFDLGGHSLLMMQLVAKMSAALNRKLPARLLLSHPTIASLAEVLSVGDAADAPGAPDCKAPPIQAPTHRPVWDNPTSFLTIERRPLLSLFAAGKIPAVEAAAIGYLPDDWLASLSREEIVDQWYDNLPGIAAVLETSLGRIGIVLVPRFASELYDNPTDLVETVREALELAGRIGARAVSLTGLIPSATDYGRAIATVSPNGNSLPAITTGHATTVSAVVLSIQKIARLADRNLRRERVGFLGLGSIGSATLALMLRCLPHPEQITLCDLYGSANTKQAESIVGKSGFQGTMRSVVSHPRVPSEFYDSTLIIGATNVAEVLDVHQLNPGTMIVDDSAPHCYCVPEAVRRLEDEHDVLFTDGGVLRSPQPIPLLRHLPRVRESLLPPAALRKLLRHEPRQITGCVLSSLLTARFEGINPTLGLVTSDESVEHYLQLGRLGFDAADLHSVEYTVAEEWIQLFRNRFGGSSG